MKLWLICLASAPCITIQAALIPHPIAHEASKQWVQEGVYEGGSEVRSNLHALRFGKHSGFERWVVDFVDPKGSSAKRAPKFHLSYKKSARANSARLLVAFRGIDSSLLDLAQISTLCARARLVSDIVIYPPVDGGYAAIEFTLNDRVGFFAHQPLHPEDRLVIDFGII